MRLNHPVEVLFVAPLPERAAKAIHCLRVNYHDHVQRPLVRDNVAGESCVLCLCASVLCAGYMGVGVRPLVRDNVAGESCVPCLCMYGLWGSCQGVVIEHEAGWRTRGNLPRTRLSLPQPFGGKKGRAYTTVWSSP